MEIKKIDLDQNTVPPKAQTVVISSDKKQTDSKPTMSKQTAIITFILFIIAVGSGVFTGAWLKTNKSAASPSSTSSGIQSAVPESGVKIGDIYGSADENGFKDKVTGVLDKGGFNGEGTHQLVRPGGPSQTVYLTSSVIDLDLLVGHQITIWGETFKGQKVGWLMDVGRAKVENLNAPLPK